MGLSPTLPDANITAKETPPAFSPLGLRCVVLCAAHGLSLALPSLQLSAVADRVLSFHTILPHWSVTCLYRALRDTERRRIGKDPDPSAAIIDAQSVNTVEESGCIRVFDPHNTALHHTVVEN